MIAGTLKRGMFVTPVRRQEHTHVTPTSTTPRCLARWAVNDSWRVIIRPPLEQARSFIECWEERAHLSMRRSSMDKVGSFHPSCDCWIPFAFARMMQHTCFSRWYGEIESWHTIAHTERHALKLGLAQPAASRACPHTAKNAPGLVS